MAVGSDNSGCTKPQEVPSWLEGIDGESLPKLILSDAPVIRVVAGPGSGKTLGLRRRVQRLIELNEVDPSRIFVGTFTRAITTELARSLDQHVVEGISVRTLHSLAYQLLHSNPAALLGRSLRLMLNFETRPMLYDVGNALPEPSNDSQRRSLLRQLQANYAHKRDQTEAAFAGELERWLIEHRGILIDEIVPLATRGLESSDIGSGQFDHVLIDEYQDLTASEQALVEQIWSHAG